MKTPLLELLEEYKSPPVPLVYGTAGFRGLASTLDIAAVRSGVLAACLSRSHNGDAIGTMVTASHNPPQDNGLKIVEPDGSMLAQSWEPIFASFVNADHSTLPDHLELPSITKRGVVVLGRDTRESSSHLADLFTRAVRAAGGNVVSVGVVTTPQLHVAVRMWNTEGDINLQRHTESLRNSIHGIFRFGRIDPSLTESLVIDCANGVGSKAILPLASALGGPAVVNTVGDGPLNYECGADYVHKNRCLPKVHSGTIVHGSLWASLDGDADRLVMYCLERGGRAITLADGDRFAVLLTDFIAKHLKLLKLSLLSVAVAQTAYSNGAATDYLSALDGVSVVITKTGVKHLEKAVKQYDIGVYWEPNGHGTVLFSTRALKVLNEEIRIASQQQSTEKEASLRGLLLVARVANQAVGDGVADLVLVLSVLTHEGKTINEWLSMYDERCSCQLVVSVADKYVIETADFDRQVAKPMALREAIADAVGGEGCRAFVRPSGTEDVVRVYAEAPRGDEETARKMAVRIAQCVFDTCGGVGKRP